MMTLDDAQRTLDMLDAGHFDSYMPAVARNLRADALRVLDEPFEVQVLRVYAARSYNGAPFLAVTVDCARCRRTHCHGLGSEPPTPGVQHRVAHCTNAKGGGYTFRLTPSQCAAAAKELAEAQAHHKARCA